MEIVSIERKTFEAMVAKFDRFVHRMEAICQRHGEKRISEWMDNQDVCRMLNISPRKLQTLRDNGTLAWAERAARPPRAGRTDLVGIENVRESFISVPPAGVGL